MAVIDEVNEGIGRALKARETLKLGALRLLKAALVNRSVEKGRPLDEVEERQVVSTLVKQRREAADQFRQANRLDLAEHESAEIPILESYLPAKAEEAEVEATVDRAIAETGASSPKDIGRVMKTAMAVLSGKTVDGRIVNEMVRRKLAQKA